MTDANRVTIERETLQAALDALEATLPAQHFRDMPRRKQSIAAIATLRAALAAQPAKHGRVAWQGGMSNETLMREWQKKLPGRIPEGQELSAFAVGVEVGLDHARKLEREDWSRVHHVLFKHGVHPGRTDDHLADVIDKALAAPPAPAAVPLLTDAQVDAISMGLFGCINAAYRKQITDAVLSSGGGGITCATKRTVAQVRTATSAAPAAVPLTDEQILQIAEPFGAFQYGDAQGHVRIEFARAVLASGEKT